MAANTPLLQIVNWQSTFEELNSRALDISDSPRLLSVVEEEDGAAVFGILMLIVDLCRQHPNPRNGWLTHNGAKDGDRMTLAGLSAAFHRPQMEIHRCFQSCSARGANFLRFEEGDLDTLHQAYLNRDRS